MTAQTTSSPVAPPSIPAEGPGAGTLPGLLCHQARTRATEVAIREKAYGIWRSITWEAYFTQVRATAMALQDLGLSAGDRAGIIADNEPSWLFADLGIQSLGAWSIAIYPTQTRDEVSYIVAHADCRIMFCGDQEQTDKIIESRDAGELPALEHIVVFDMKGVREYDDPMVIAFEELVARGARLDGTSPELYVEHLSRRDPEEVAFVGYTSGTTGKPKGALLKHRNQVTMAAVMSGWNSFSEKDRIFCHFPLCHPAVRVSEAYVSLFSGASLNFPESPESVPTDMFELAPTSILGTPRVFEVMKADIDTRMTRAAAPKRLIHRWGMKVLRRDLDARLAGGKGNPAGRALAQLLVGRWIRDKLGFLQLRTATLGGASVSPELLKYFWALGVPIFETYGQSETSGMAFAQRSYDDLGTAGWVLPTLEARIGEDRELLLRGDGIFAGYLDAPEQTAEAFVDGEWYRTGDIARFDDAGRVVILDREKYVIHTSAGDELAPSEIENTLKLSAYVADAMVIGAERSRIGALIQLEYDTVAEWAQHEGLAYTTFKSLTELPQVLALIERAVEEANALLPEAKRVATFRLLPRELDPDLDEMTPTRKIKRNVVEERFGALIEDMYLGDPAPPTATS